MVSMEGADIQHFQSLNWFCACVLSKELEISYKSYLRLYIQLPLVLTFHVTITATQASNNLCSWCV